MQFSDYFYSILFLGLFLFIILFFKYPRWAIAGLIIAKPIIDTTSSHYIYSNINLLKIYGFLFAVLGTIYIIKNRLRVLQCSVSPLWILFLALNFVSIFFIADKNLLDKAEYFIRILVGFSALILFFNLFDFEKDKKIVFSIFVLSGTVCVIIWLIEVLFMTPRTSVAGISDELTRIKGPYHHFFNFPFYSLQLIICSLPLLAPIHQLKLTDNKNKFNLNISISIILYFLIAVSIFIVYKSYTKSGWVVLPVILFLWFIFRKKIIPALIVVAGVILFLSINPFKTEASSLFRKEIDIIFLKSKKWEPDTLFMGRYRRWKGGMQEFKQIPLLNKLFGSPEIHSGPENDYLRILWHNGILGLVVFLLLIGQSAYYMIQGYIKNKDPVFLSGLFVIIFYLLYAIGSYPLLYPAFNWLVWGILGFLLSEILKKE